MVAASSRGGGDGGSGRGGNGRGEGADGMMHGPGMPGAHGAEAARMVEGQQFWRVVYGGEGRGRGEGKLGGGGEYQVR